MKKKNGFIIATAILVATLSVGGTAYGHSRNAQLSDADVSIKHEQLSLNSIKSDLGKMVDKSGYLTSSATRSKLESYKKSVEHLSDSYVDFHIKKDDLKNDLQIVKIGKEKVLNKINTIESKLKVQDEVNSMFTSAVINGSTAQEQPIVKTLTADQVNKVKGDIPKGDTSDWAKSVQTMIDDANAQLKQIDQANQILGKLIQNGKVVNGVTKDDYNQALSVISAIKNPEIKQNLLNQLAQVLQVVESQEQTVKVSSVEQGSSAGTASQPQTPTQSTQQPASTSVATPRVESAPVQSQPTRTYSAPAQSQPTRTYTAPSTGGAVSTNHASSGAVSGTASPKTSSSSSGGSTSAPTTVQGTQTGSGEVYNQNGTDTGHSYTTGGVVIPNGFGQ